MDYVKIAQKLSQEVAAKGNVPYMANVGVKVKAEEMLINVIRADGMVTFMLLNGPEDGMTIAKYQLTTGVASVEGTNLVSIRGLTSVVEEYFKYEAAQAAARQAQERAIQDQAVQQFQQQQQTAQPQVAPQDSGPVPGAVHQPVTGAVQAAPPPFAQPGQL